MSHPPERTEWVDGQLIEKKVMTFGFRRLTQYSWFITHLVALGLMWRRSLSVDLQDKGAVAQFYDVGVC